MSDSTQELMGWFADCAYCDKPIMAWEERRSLDGGFQWAHLDCFNHHKELDDGSLYEQGDA